MKQKLYFFIGCLLMLQATNSIAQCPAGRYAFSPYYFSSYVFHDSVVYSNVTGDVEAMDIYEPPLTDTMSARPCIILAHEGTFISGTRNSDKTVDSLCVHYAKRGYVTVSIDYRLASSVLVMLNLSTAANEVAAAMSDGKAAIRFMVNNRTTYKIDTNNIFIGGNSAGAVLYMHVGYIDSSGECDPLLLTAMDANGGFEGNSGTPGHTTRAKGVIDLAGALHNVSLAGPGDVASVNCQGDQDNVVPYTCGLPLGGACPDSLCGLGSLEAQYVSAGINHMSLVFPGSNHVPWDADAAMFYSVDSIVNVFLMNQVCSDVTSVNNVTVNTEVSLFPNPANDVLNIRASEPVSEVIMYDETGRTVMQVNGINRADYELNTSRFIKGMYFVKMKFVNENNAPVTKRIIVD